jgi:uncharacterized protein YbjQ (UPF0145 family)
VLVVTTNDIPGWEIRSRNAFAQIGAGFKSMFGGELQGMTKNLADSRNKAMGRLINEARNRAANAVIGMRFDTTELGDVWMTICAYGTAVNVAKVRWIDSGCSCIALVRASNTPKPRRHLLDEPVRLHEIRQEGRANVTGWAHHQIVGADDASLR